jgi:hypothetical protein
MKTLTAKVQEETWIKIRRFEEVGLAKSIQGFIHDAIIEKIEKVEKDQKASGENVAQ